MTIDIHAHVFFDELLGGIPGLGPSIEQTEGGRLLVVGGYRWPLRPGPLTPDPGQRVRELDAAGISRQVLSLSPLWLFPRADRDAAVAFHTRANDLLAAWCAVAPSRLLGVASLPTQDVDAAVRELTRAVTELGLVGGYIGTDARPGLDDPELDALYLACERLDVPLFVHSAMAGIDTPGDPRLDRWLGGVVYGYPFEETLAVASLVFGGVLDRHPGVDVVLSHGGGTAPFLHGRMREFSGLPASPIGTAQFDEAFGRLWFDTHVHSAGSLRLLAEVANPRHLVFGSNFGGWDRGAPSELDGILPSVDANARRLLRIGGERA